jgi:uncharacterized protein
VSDEPVTVLVSRRVKPGREAEFETWLEEVRKAAMTFPGHQGVTISRPLDSARPDYLIVFRFDSAAHLAAWRESDVRKQLIDRSADLAQEPPEERPLTGLETWFAVPGGQVLRPPARWKVWLLSSAAIYPLITAITVAAAPVLMQLALPLRFLVTIPVMGALMTWLVMPALTRLFTRWLY